MKPQAKPKEPKKWHSQQEIILKSWGESSSCYRYLHFQSYLKFKASSMNFTLPIIVISTITGTANFAQETFPVSIQEYVPLGIGGLNLFAAILTTVLQFLKVNELMEAHRVASISYGKLARDIKLELSLPRSERHHHGDQLISRCSSEYDRLIEQSPPIPGDILNKFEKTYKNSEEFDKPEITLIQPIKLFDSVKETQIAQAAAGMFKRGASLFNKLKPGAQEAKNVIASSGGHSITIDTKQNFSDSEPEKEPPVKSYANTKKAVMDELLSLKSKNLVSIGSKKDDSDEEEEEVEVVVEDPPTEGTEEFKDSVNSLD